MVEVKNLKQMLTDMVYSGGDRKLELRQEIYAWLREGPHDTLVRQIQYLGDSRLANQLLGVGVPARLMAYAYRARREN